MSRLIVASVAAIAFAISGLTPALAHASLTKCSIKNHQVFRVGHAPSVIHASFAEPLDTNRNKTWMAVFEGQADHGLVTEKQHSVVNFKNPKQMTLKLPKLGKEKYYLIWYTHSAVDGHYAAGIVYFSVK